ncbi:MAG: precorrin-6x reductase [Bacteroidetes bacterium]|nr:precorrin-6x reductase [Bacteroidota bacterium]
MIWIIGGTSNAVEISRLMQAEQLPHLVTVTTALGRNIAALEGSTVLTGALTPQDMGQLIDDRSITTVVDASHPFAVDVSRQAMIVCEQKAIRYIRYERKQVRHAAARYFGDYEGLIAYLQNTSGNVLITTGSKYCAKYLPLGVERLFVRVLNTPASLQQTDEAGYPPDHVLTMRAVVSEAENLQTMKELKIRYLVTKDSGVDGGLDEKILAAQSVGAEVLIIDRPQLEYPLVFTDYSELMQSIIHPKSFEA